MREGELIRHLAARAATPRDMLGIGDDCCAWTPGGRTCLSVDQIVEGVHFTAATPPASVGRKAAAAAISDLAAAGAKPVGAVVAIGVPVHWDGIAVMDGLLDELSRLGCPLLGGDTTASPHLTVAVTVWGEAIATGHGPGRLLSRRGAQAGDLLVITGPLGGSFGARSGPELGQGRHLRPEPRLAEGQWFAQCPYITAAMDLSDGLASDGPKLAEASACGCLLLPGQVPVHDDVPVLQDGVKAALTDGEDFELLVAVAPEHWPALQLAWPFDRPLYVVGWLTPDLQHTMEDASGRRVPLAFRGYEH